MKSLFEEGRNQAVTVLEQSKNVLTNEGKSTITAGYSDGEIFIWNCETAVVATRLSGHTAAVNQIVFLQQDTILVSSGFDTAIIVWDLVAESPLYKYDQPNPNPSSEPPSNAP